MDLSNTQNRVSYPLHMPNTFSLSQTVVPLHGHALFSLLRMRTDDGKA